MPHTYQELKGKTIEDLRDIAKGLDNEAVKGFSQMNKIHLLPALCQALGIDTYVHHHAEGIDKPAVKARMKELKKQRDAAIEKHDRGAPEKHPPATASLQPADSRAHALRECVLFWVLCSVCFLVRRSVRRTRDPEPTARIQNLRTQHQEPYDGISAVTALHLADPRLTQRRKDAEFAF